MLPYDKNREPHKVIKAWESITGWYWFAFEEVEPNFYFGLVQGLEEELGFFDGEELDNTHGIWKIRKHNIPYAGKR